LKPFPLNADPIDSRLPIFPLQSMRFYPLGFAYTP
jgi:hypothetical protein